MGQDEFTEGVVQREAIDGAAVHGNDELSRGAVHGKPRSDLLGTGTQHILRGNLRAGTDEVVGQLEDTEDSADRDTGVDVGGAVDGVADNSVSCVGILVEDDCFLFFFRDQDPAAAAAAHG